MMATHVSKPESGKIYRIADPRATEVTSPRWMRVGRLVVGDLLLCLGGGKYFLLDLDDGELHAVGIDQDGDASLTIVAKLVGIPTQWQPTRKEALSLQRGDVLKGEPYTKLAAEVGVTATMELPAVNGYEARRTVVAPIGEP